MIRSQQDPTSKISSRQVAAARALLGWSQDHLADLAGVTRKTLGNFESGKEITLPKLKKVLEVLEEAGVRFIALDKEVGVVAKIRD